VLIGLGGQAFVRNAQVAHFEGFVFVISLVVVLQGLLMLFALGRAGTGDARSRSV
jgi:Flp pilus assembly protein protease CpaA